MYIDRTRYDAVLLSGSPPLRPGPRKPRPSQRAARLKGVLPTVCALLLLSAESALAQPVDCDAYARSYANSYMGSGNQDLDAVDGAMRGAVAGGAWRGPSGARRGALAGGALGVLDSLGSTPEGWNALYDMAFRLCQNQNSAITHHPQTLGDPTLHGGPGAYGYDYPVPSPGRPSDLGTERGPLDPPPGPSPLEPPVTPYNQ
ncbi:hypothetical protein E1178_20190 [Roseibium hamelinense]|uniref:hypothetical protein n=1 Tax=Roseibium hamelinense TaxID=150831 RepID=UPI0012BBC039|nr:hypothetical protein [Roseibium hamelinense]MTI45931.1 hypothetical protein [Roseibium hamelinense]